jgi:hypothetical protein
MSTATTTRIEDVSVTLGEDVPEMRESTARASAPTSPAEYLAQA